MKTRSFINRVSSRLGTAFVMAAVAWLACCASAEAGCGSHFARPVVALDWQSGSPELERQVPREKQPSCSGRTCAGNPASPLATTTDPAHYRDLFVAVSIELLLVQPARSVDNRAASMSPIDRETKIERPPCRAAMTAARL